MRALLPSILALTGCLGPSTLDVGGGQGVVIDDRLVLAPAHVVQDGEADVDGQRGRVVLWLAAEPEPWALLSVERALERERVSLAGPEPGDSGAPVVSHGRLLGLVTGRQGGTVVVSTLERRQ
jgi:hypothetical protein